ncbi:MAG: hypothetical protein HYV09_10295 [Deltaproteobacteria bacterium]|nr:hypothetical protein [Deltaproteobacteria bacterium]
MRAPLLAVLLALSFAAAPSSGATVPTLEERYKTAVKLENAGNVVDALAMFEAIPKEQRDFNTRLHIASCKRKLGRMLESAKEYEAIVADPTADGPTRETAQSDLDAVVAATPRIRVKLAGTAADVRVAIDGVTVVAPADRAVDPGTRVVTGSRGSTKVFERTVQLAEGTKVDVLVDAPAATVAAAPAAAPAPSEGGIDKGSPRWTAGWIGAGVGAAALGVGTWALLRIPGLEKERDELAAQGDRAAADRASDARSMQTIARIGYGVGAVAIGTAAFFFLTTPRRATSTALQVAPTVAGAWGLSLQGAW